MPLDPALYARGAAIVTRASDIGLAAAKRFAASGLRVCAADPDVRELGELRQFGARMYARFGVVLSVIGAMIIGSSSAIMARQTLTSHPREGVINAACLPWQVSIGHRQPVAADTPGDFTPVPHGGRRVINTACVPWQAPIGHRQPGAADLPGYFTPERAELQALDKAIDRKLAICRAC
jgi:hypothetical protein